MTCGMHKPPKKSFPQKGSIRKRLGTNAALLINPNNDFNMEILFFGSYAMVYICTRDNINHSRIPSITLRESKEYGGNFFMSLYTVKEIHINN